MAQYHLIQTLSLLVTTVVALAILVFDGMMIAEVRRKRLPQFLGWLIPAMIAATIGVIDHFLQDFRFVVGLRNTLQFANFVSVSNIVTGIFASWAVVGLWQMIRHLPFGNQPEAAQDSLVEIQGIWPPPPTGRT